MDIPWYGWIAIIGVAAWAVVVISGGLANARRKSGMAGSDDVAQQSVAAQQAVLARLDAIDTRLGVDREDAHRHPLSATARSRAALSINSVCSRAAYPGTMRVLAAMSGGVDSAVAAARAVDAGHDVVGVHLALSRNPGTLRTGARGCCTIEDSMDARRAATLLGIPFYVWDFSERFKARRRG